MYIAMVQGVREMAPVFRKLVHLRHLTIVGDAYFQLSSECAGAIAASLRSLGVLESFTLTCCRCWPHLLTPCSAFHSKLLGSVLPFFFPEWHFFCGWYHISLKVYGTRMFGGMMCYASILSCIHNMQIYSIARTVDQYRMQGQQHVLWKRKVCLQAQRSPHVTACILRMQVYRRSA
jgi:hypothetical protein